MSFHCFSNIEEDEDAYSQEDVDVAFMAFTEVCCYSLLSLNLYACIAIWNLMFDDGNILTCILVCAFFCLLANS